MGVHEDLIGKRYGNLTVISRDKNRNNRVYWKCQCDCGNTVSVFSSNLKRGLKTHCGCKRKGNITGQRFGNLTAICPVGKNQYSEIWKCRCDCGNERIISYAELKRGKAKSCGCMRISASYVHGLNGSRIQRIYYNMLDRCNNPKCKIYKDYGERGISVCEEWSGEKGFENFYKWAFDNGYEDVLTLDRENNEKGYSPDNCRWADIFVQANNKRNNIFLEYGGKRLTIGEWSRETGINYKTLWNRYKWGWKPERILEMNKK